MKKLFAIVAMLGMFAFGTTQVMAQDAPAADAQTEVVDSTATEAAPETDADNLVPEPAIQKGCGAALAPAGMILLCLVGFAFGRKEDRDA